MHNKTMLNKQAELAPPCCTLHMHNKTMLNKAELAHGVRQARVSTRFLILQGWPEPYSVRNDGVCTVFSACGHILCVCV